MTYSEIVSNRHHRRGGLCKSAASDFHAMHNDAIDGYIGLRGKYLELDEPLSELYKLLAKKRVYFKRPQSNPATKDFFDIRDLMDMARLGYKSSMDDRTLMDSIQFYKEHDRPLSPYEVKELIADRARRAAKYDIEFDSLRKAQQAAEASASKPASDKPRQVVTSTETTEKAPEAAKPFNVRNYMGRAVGTTAGGTIGALAGNNLRNKILLGMLGGGTGYLAGDYYDRGSNSLVGRGASKLMSLLRATGTSFLRTS